jgi:3-oxoacyl-[acyl-carrier protein] reductase
MNTDLSNLRAVVCGSSQGIGRAIALELARMGASVTLFARDESRLKAVLAELDQGRGQSHGYLVADFDRPAEVREVIHRFAEQEGTAHILINNSGGPPPGEVLEAGPDDFLRAFSRHLLCNQAMVQALVPGMKKASYGRIINVVSTSVVVPIPGLGVSNTVRGAVASWAKTLSNELAASGITVNNILPGLTLTGRLESLIRTRAAAQGIPEEEQRRRMQEAIPARRFADPSEPAALAAFLASPSAGYITGTSIRVDGGSTPAL